MSPPPVYLDADSCWARLTAAMERLGFDVALGTVEVREGASDWEQLARAVAMRRVLVTGNTVDFARIHAEYARRGDEHFGIVTWAQKRRRSPEALAGLVLELLTDRTLEDLRNSFHGL